MCRQKCTRNRQPKVSHPATLSIRTSSRYLNEKFLKFMHRFNYILCTWENTNKRKDQVTYLVDFYIYTSASPQKLFWSVHIV